MTQLHSRTQQTDSDRLANAPEGRLRVHILYTGIQATQRALRAAADYAGALQADFEVLVPHVVPYALPLTEPPVGTDFIKKHILEAFGRQGYEWTARICLCRDREAGMKFLLPPKSVVVMGLTRRWWPFRDAVLVRRLRRAGHHVIVAQVGNGHA